MAQKEHCKLKDWHLVTANDVLERGEGALVTVAAARAAQAYSYRYKMCWNFEQISYVRHRQLRSQNAIECRRGSAIYIDIVCALSATNMTEKEEGTTATTTTTRCEKEEGTTQMLLQQ